MNNLTFNNGAYKLEKANGEVYEGVVSNLIAHFLTDTITITDRVTLVKLPIITAQSNNLQIGGQTKTFEQIKTIIETELAKGGGASSADAVSYDNTTSGLQSTNVQGAIDEIGANLGELENKLTLKYEFLDIIRKLQNRYGVNIIKGGYNSTNGLYSFWIGDYGYDDLTSSEVQSMVDNFTNNSEPCYGGYKGVISRIMFPMICYGNINNISASAVNAAIYNTNIRIYSFTTPNAVISISPSTALQGMANIEVFLGIINFNSDYSIPSACTKLRIIQMTPNISNNGRNIDLSPCEMLERYSLNFVINYNKQTVLNRPCEITLHPTIYNKLQTEWADLIALNNERATPIIFKSA